MRQNIERRQGTQWTTDLRDAALAFALADHRWRALSADRDNWVWPARRQVLTAAFIEHHTARLALEAMSPSKSG